jgi:hypothetical protein
MYIEVRKEQADGVVGMYMIEGDRQTVGPVGLVVGRKVEMT